MIKKTLSSSRGFTIIELLIATAVFSTILVVVTGMMIKVGNLYYKGINQSRIQDAVRGVTDEFAGHLKLTKPDSVVAGTYITPGPATHTENTKHARAICIGDVRYTYVLDKKLVSASPTSDQALHVLWRDTNETPGSCTLDQGFPDSLPTLASTGLPDPEGVELMAPKARLLTLCIGTATRAAPTCAPDNSSPYDITVAAAYGDSDLLTAPVAGVHNLNTHCLGGVGQEFCGTAHLTTSVARRIN